MKADLLKAIPFLIFGGMILFGVSFTLPVLAKLPVNSLLAGFLYLLGVMLLYSGANGLLITIFNYIKTPSIFSLFFGAKKLDKPMTIKQVEYEALRKNIELAPFSALISFLVLSFLVYPFLQNIPFIEASLLFGIILSQVLILSFINALISDLFFRLNIEIQAEQYFMQHPPIQQGEKK